ncbi:hypothetical protein D3C84_805570 [compost metagenome]
MHRGRGVGTCAHADHATAGAIGAADIVYQHVAGDGATLGHRSRIGLGGRQVVDDLDVDFATRFAAVGIHGDDFEVLGDAVGAVGVGVGVGVVEGVAVAHHAGGRVKAGDGQGAAYPGAAGDRQALHHATADNLDAGNAQALQAVRGVHGEGPVLGQRRGVGVAAVGEVFLVDGQFAACDVQATEGHPVVVVVHVQHQVGGAAVAVGVGQGVGEGLGAVATAVQTLEVGVAGIERVGVGAIGV